MPAPPRAQPPMPTQRRPLPGSRPPVPGPRQPRQGPPPGYRRAPAPRPQMRPQHHRRRRASRGRRIILGVLVIATVAAGIWWFIGRGTSAAGRDFASVEHRFVSAARAVPGTTEVVQRFRDLEKFDAALDAQAIVMQRSLAEFDTIANEEDGEASDLARDAINTGERALRAVSRFRAAITTSNDMADAQDALVDLDREVDDLEATLRQWNRL